MADEVALFIDLENIATSMWNLYRQEIDPLALVEKARKYGLLSFARAYGDFAQPHLDRLQNSLRVAGIEPFNCPVKQYAERSQSTVDVNIAIDLYEVSLDRPGTGTIVLMSGDRDFVRVVTRLRHRLGRSVVIAGVPGTVSRDLVMAAGAEDPVEPLPSAVDETAVLRLIDGYEKSRHEGVLPIWSGLSMWLKHNSNAAVVDPKIVDGLLSDFVQRGILRQAEETSSEGRTIRTTRLAWDHPEVAAALG